MNGKGSFEISPQVEPPFEVVDEVSLGRATFDKTFAGTLEATSKVHMLAARTAVQNSMAYVAIERIQGALDGKTGSFVVLHLATMNRGVRALSLQIVPDSGTGQLAGIAGHMDIQIVEGQHFYTIEYALPA